MNKIGDIFISTACRAYCKCVGMDDNFIHLQFCSSEGKVLFPEKEPFCLHKESIKNSAWRKTGVTYEL